MSLGPFMGYKIFNEQNKECRVMRFRDSLGFKCPMFIKKFLAAVADICFPVEQSTWKYPTSNYILDDLRYPKKEDAYSCGPYVLSALCHTARTRGCLPQEGYSSGYKAAVTEKFRWACVESRVRSILATSVKYGVVQSCEITGDQYVLLTRRKKYGSQHVVKCKPELQHKVRRKRCKRVDKTRLTKSSRNLNKKKVMFSDSFMVVSDIIDDVIELVLGCVHKHYPNEEMEDKTECTLQGTGQLKGEELVVENFPRFLQRIHENGYSFGLHFCRERVCKTKRCCLTLRIRCLQFSSSCKCRAAINCKLRTNRTTWDVKSTMGHSHPSQKLTDAEVMKRVQRLCKSIMFYLSTDLREQMKNRLAVETTKSVQPQRERNRPMRSELLGGYDGTANLHDRESLASSSVMSNCTEMVQPALNTNMSTATDDFSLRDGVATPSKHETNATEENFGEADKLVSEESGLDEFAEDYGNVSEIGLPNPHSPTQDRKLFFQHQEMIAAITAFIEEISINSAGKDVLKRIQYIAEGFGYFISVRDSKYRGLVLPKAVNGQPLERAILLCKTHREEGCRFNMTVMTRDEGSLDDSNNRIGMSWRYNCNMTRAVHSHDPEESAFLKCFPPETTEQAVRMHNVLKMSYTDVLLCLEDKYSIKINREVLRQHLKYLRKKHAPRDEDSFRLCQSLFEIQEKNCRHKFFFPQRDRIRCTLRHGCWSIGWTISRSLESFLGLAWIANLLPTGSVIRYFLSTGEHLADRCAHISWVLFPRKRKRASNGCYRSLNPRSLFLLIWLLLTRTLQ